MGTNTSLTNYHFVDPAQNPKDRIPLEDLYSEQYKVEEARAYQRITDPIGQAIGQPPMPEPTPQEPKSVAVDISPEGLAASSDAAKRIPVLEARRKISGEFKDPTLRGAVNSVLNTLTGGSLNLDVIDEHLKAEVEGGQSDATAKVLAIPSV